MRTIELVKLSGLFWMPNLPRYPILCIDSLERLTKQSFKGVRRIKVEYSLESFPGSSSIRIENGYGIKGKRLFGIFNKAFELIRGLNPPGINFNLYFKITPLT